MVSESAAAFPLAEGARVDWNQLPADTRSVVEAGLGAPVSFASTRRGGFSPGLASRLHLADGRDVFLKLVATDANPESINIHRREARITAALPRVPHAPALLWSHDAGDWMALAFEYIDAATVPLPWNRYDLDRVLDALVELSQGLTPSPIAVESAGELFGATLMQWRALPDHPEELARIPPAWQERVDELAELERHWPDLASGSSLLHLDVRADNILLTAERVHFVDWPWAAIGAHWIDLVALLPSVAMQGGPDPEEVWRAHRWSGDADDEAVDAFLAGFAGMLTCGALRPPPPGLPTLRAFQGAQGDIARAWLARRRGWSDAIGS
jgi:hypothetical protein